MPHRSGRMEMTGLRFGRLLVEGPGRVVPKRVLMWWCRCDCGQRLEVRGPALRSGNTSSCGCLHVEGLRKRSTVHGHRLVGTTSSREYNSWATMWARTKSKHPKTWAIYGSRGIRVCDRWIRFEVFLADMGPRPPGTSLDRVDNDGNYEPANCRWATPSQQSLNRRPWIKKNSKMRRKGDPGTVHPELAPLNGQLERGESTHGR